MTIRLRESLVLATVTTALSTSLAALEPRIVKPTLDDNEAVVADLVLSDEPYRADPTGQEDITAILQRAMDDLAKAGGGVIYIPAGVYRFDGNLKMPGGISLRGDWKSPLEGGSGKGTILAVYAGRGQADGAPFILATGGESAVRNLSFWYPEQTVNNVQPYPPTVSRAYRAILHYNLTFYNSYEGMSCIHAAGKPNHENIYGTFLKRGIFNDNNLEYGFIDRVYISPAIWADAPADVITNAPKTNRKALVDHCRKNTEGIFLGDADNVQLYDITVEDAKAGIRYDETVLPMARKGQAPYGLQMKINATRDVRRIDTYAGEFLNLDEIPQLRGKEYSWAPLGRPARADVFVNVRKAPWNAAGDGKTDDTRAIQRALDQAGKQGGGIVYLPAGEYVVRTHLTIPSGVELRGGYDYAHRSDSLVTALFAYEGENAWDTEQFPAFISMEQESGLVGVVIFYPNQNDLYPSVEESPPKTYPWTIRGLGENTYLRYVTIKRGWDLIDMASHDCSGFSMRGLWTAPLNRGMYIGGGTRGGRMEKIIQTMGAFSYPGKKTPDVPNWTKELHKKWVWTTLSDYYLNNVKGTQFGDVRNVQGLGVICFHLKHHMMFLPQNGQGPENIEIFLAPSEGTGSSTFNFESGDAIRIYGTACGGSPVATSDAFKGQVDMYGLFSWYGRITPEIKGGSVDIHPKAPPGTTTLSVTPHESSGLIKRINYFKAKPGDTVSTIKGKTCWTLSPRADDPKVSFLDIRVAYDQWRFGRIPKVRISLEYLDEGTGSIDVIYDAAAEARKKLDTISLTGSATWKTWTREVDDAMFACSIPWPYRNDDLVFVTRTSKPLSVSRVSITRSGWVE